MKPDNDSPREDSSPEHPSLFSELKRRKVFRATAAYLVVAWIVIQVASIILPTFDVPAWSMRLVIIMAALGFPLVIVLAWAFELTPKGMQRTPDSDEEVEENYAKAHNRKRNLAAFGLGAVVPTVGFLVILGYLILSGGRAPVVEDSADKSIAVLPFENMSANEENAFFAGGVHEDILTNLTGINDLKVTSRTSVMRYAENKENIKAIGEELGVHYIVEGSVRRVGDDVRVTIQLIDAKTDQHLWAQNYDRKLVNIFALQSSIAKEIATTLQARISPDEEAILDKVPTTNLAAYDAYLQARTVVSWNWVEFDELRAAITQLEEAVTADPDFSEAHAVLAQLNAQLLWQSKRLEDAETLVPEIEKSVVAALNEAKRIDPDHATTLRAEAFYLYVIKRDYLGALRALDKALLYSPNDADSIAFMGYIYRRLKQPDESIEHFEKAYVLDRANAMLIDDLIRSYELTRRYDKIAPLYQQLARLDPEQTNYQIEAKYYEFMAEGSLAAFHEFEESLHTVEKTEKCNLRTWRNGHMSCALLKGEFDKYAVEWRAQWKAHYDFHGDWVCPVQINDEANHAALMMKSGDTEAAQEVVDKALHEITLPIRENSGCIVETAIIMPKLQYVKGDHETARKEFQAAVVKLNGSEESFQKMWDKLNMLEAADMVVPDQVYSFYKEYTSEPIGFVSLEYICTNPWSFPNLLGTPEFKQEIMEDGRFVEFLEHFALL